MATWREGGKGMWREGEQEGKRGKSKRVREGGGGQAALFLVGLPTWLLPGNFGGGPPTWQVPGNCGGGI